MPDQLYNINPEDYASAVGDVTDTQLSIDLHDFTSSNGYADLPQEKIDLLLVICDNVEEIETGKGEAIIDVVKPRPRPIVP